MTANLSLRDIFLLALLSGFLAGLALFGQPSGAHAQLTGQLNTLRVPAKPNGEFAEVTISDPTIDFVIIEAAVGAGAISRPIEVELDGPTMKAVVEVVSSGARQPWYLDFYDNGSRTKVLEITSQTKFAQKLTLLKEQFPGLTISEIADFYGMTLNKVLEYLFPEDDLLPSGITLKGVLNADSCTTGGSQYLLRLVVNIQSLSDATMRRGVTIRSRLAVGEQTLVGQRLVLKRRQIQNNREIALVRVPGPRLSTLRTVKWSNGIPTVGRKLNVVRYIQRRRGVLAAVDVTGVPSSTIERVSRDLSDVTSGCLKR